MLSHDHNYNSEAGQSALWNRIQKHKAAEERVKASQVRAHIRELRALLRQYFGPAIYRTLGLIDITPPAPGEQMSEAIKRLSLSSSPAGIMAARIGTVGIKLPGRLIIFHTAEPSDGKPRVHVYLYTTNPALWSSLNQYCLWFSNNYTPTERIAQFVKLIAKDI